MRVPYSWLLEFIEVDLPPEELAESLTMQGLAVDAVERPGRALDGVVVGRVASIRPHPDADRLWCCEVDAGDRRLSIVTGAPNIKMAVDAGLAVLVARPGTTLPGGLRIEARTLRGELSQGMLCSAAELGLESAADDGVLLLQEGVPGQPAAAALGLDDAVLVFDLTPNYAAHCQSVLGVAREVSALLDRPLRLRTPEFEAEPGPAPVRVEIEDPELCPRYTARLIRDVTPGPSPAWMQRRLRLAGMRPINNIVDITNYVMLELGQPLHAFDAGRLEGGIIRVRRAQAGERLQTLDGQTRELQPDDLVIADGARAVALAGVMGGADSEVTEATTAVLLEAAAFSPLHVARTSRRLGLRSEASGRFEKGVDVEAVDLASRRACELFGRLAGGRVQGPPAEERTPPGPPRMIRVEAVRVNRLLGTDLSSETMAELLRRLHMVVRTEVGPQAGGALSVQIPSFRPDLSCWQDLAEEVGRLYGYNRIPSRMPPAPVAEPLPPSLPDEAEEVRQWMAASGLQEVVTFAFTSRRALARWGWGEGDRRRDPLALANPLGEEQGVLRTSLLPNLAEALAYNHRQQEEDAALFEVGRVFLRRSEPVDPLPEERLHLGLILSGAWQGGGWQGESHEADFFLAKGLIESLAERLRLAAVEWRPSGEEPGFHPGRTAVLLAAGRRLGVAGELHPQLQHALGLRKRTVAAEIDLEGWLEAGRAPISFHSVPRYPAVSRDLALLVPESLSAAEVGAAIRTAAGDLLESYHLFDVYSGPSLGQGRRSLAFRLVYRSPERTLREQEVTAAQERVRAAMRELGAELRS